MKKQHRAIGLTGNIACGKSTVAKILSELGAAVIDADLVAREAVQPGGEALKKIVAEFGAGVLNIAGELDREKLRSIVFTDDVKRKCLESILHPAIRELSHSQIQAKFKSGHALVIYEATLLFEAGRQADFDGVLVISCNPKDQKARVMERDKTLTPEIAEQIIRAQMPQAEKLRLATWVIENNGTLAELRTKVGYWHDALLAN